MSQVGAAAHRTVRVLYRSLLRKTKFIDKYKVLKNLLPAETREELVQCILQTEHKQELGKVQDLLSGRDAKLTPLVRATFLHSKPHNVNSKTLSTGFLALRELSSVCNLAHRLGFPPKDLYVKETSFNEKYAKWRQSDQVLDSALNLIDKGLSCERTEEAITYFESSLALFPTADAATYLGWLYYRQGKTEEMMQLCKRAITLDPNFGNPYNDIGVGLRSLHRDNESLEWFEKAKKASRYEGRYYPYINAGSVYLNYGYYEDALREYLVALHIGPTNGPVTDVVSALVTKLRSQ